MAGSPAAAHQAALYQPFTHQFITKALIRGEAEREFVRHTGGYDDISFTIKTTYRH